MAGPVAYKTAVAFFKLILPEDDRKMK